MNKVKINVCFDDSMSWGNVLDNKNFIIYRCPKCGCDLYSWQEEKLVHYDCDAQMEKIAEVPINVIIDMLGDI